jgi:hypothetical protein
MTLRETLEETNERFNGDFWRAVEHLIQEGWGIEAFEEAGIKEIFHESFNNPIQENMQYLEQLIGEAENRGGA